MTSATALLDLAAAIRAEERQNLIEELRTWYAEHRTDYDGDPDGAIEDALTTLETA